MHIEIVNKQKDLKISLPLIRQIVSQVIQFEPYSADEVTLHFITNGAMCKLHAQYFEDASPTDCISFPLDDGTTVYRSLGDIFICPKTAVNYAYQHSKIPYEELTLYIVHGLLHLMGYDDINEKDISKMRKAERRHMKNLQRLDILKKWDTIKL